MTTFWIILLTITHLICFHIGKSIPLNRELNKHLKRAKSQNDNKNKLK